MRPSKFEGYLEQAREQTAPARGTHTTTFVAEVLTPEEHAAECEAMDREMDEREARGGW
jgi:hypothetical protein